MKHFWYNTHCLKSGASHGADKMRNVVTSASAIMRERRPRSNTAVDSYGIVAADSFSSLEHGLSYKRVYAPLTAVIVAPFVGDAAVIANIETNSFPYSINRQSHLTVSGRVNLGSFYTPSKYVALVGEWLLAHGIDESWTIADLSCGYGAFFELSSNANFAGCRFVGNDIDEEAVSAAQKMFPRTEFTVQNTLHDVTRGKFLLGEGERIVIVGNPPYNDVTSQINQRIKTGDVTMDADIKTRDLGMSSLLAYDKLKADYVAVLHPLSYLIKKANFKATARFFANYEMLEHVVFSSQEFAGTSKTTGFPVIVALYRRAEGRGLTYQAVQNIRFRTTEGDSFVLSSFDYVADHVKKYPHKDRYEPEVLFYTMRDINALKRSRTFIKERIANAVDVAPEQLSYYCYIDCFKRYAQVPYWMGNFDVPFIENEFANIMDAVVADAKFHNQDVFGEQPQPPPKDVERIRDYINKVLKQEE